MVWVVGQVDSRVPRRGQPVPGDLDQTMLSAWRVGDDDQFVAVGADPHLVTDQSRWDRVAH
jgi:hypothetical protein